MMKGATALIRILNCFAAVCEDLSRPMTPCLDAMYETTAVPPKKPDVDEIKTIEPLDPDSDTGLLFMWKAARRRAEVKTSQYIKGGRS